MCENRSETMLVGSTVSVDRGRLRESPLPSLRYNRVQKYLYFIISDKESAVYSLVKSLSTLLTYFPSLGP
jgi:hypothetical protein